MLKINSINKVFCFTIGFTLSLVIARIAYTGNHAFIFLFWNLFLAWIPLFISNQFKKNYQNRVWNVVCFIGWLLFFPNALYLVTDLVHLRERFDAPEWFDIILLFSAVMNGLMLGYASLMQTDTFLRKYFSDKKVNLIILGCFFISSFGVYLGRFLRWNSWDVITKPGSLINDVFLNVSNPLNHPRAWGMTCTLSLFFALFYFSIKKLPA
jgi:uncharacterized membrane protein